jgi:hypothetical protein
MLARVHLAQNVRRDPEMRPYKNLRISHPGCSPIALFMPAFGVGWLGSTQQNN